MKLFSRKGRVNENSSSDRDAAQKTSEYKKAKSGSGKEKANDVPDWVKGEKPYKNENGKDFAKRLLEKRFGKDAKYKTGPGSDYNKIKYLQPIITQYFIDNKSEIWLLFLIAHSKR